jgi:hypothetical protein
MNKIISSAFVSCVVFCSILFANTGAQAGEECIGSAVCHAIVLVTEGEKYNAVEATLKFPTADLGNGNPDDRYMNFYVGLDGIQNKATGCEGGYSYSFKQSPGKYTTKPVWRTFLNCGGDKGKNDGRVVVPNPSQPVRLKLVNHLNGKASLYINGIETHTVNTSLMEPAPAKVVYAVLDRTQQLAWKDAAFTQIKVCNQNCTRGNSFKTALKLVMREETWNRNSPLAPRIKFLWDGKTTSLRGERIKQ